VIEQLQLSADETCLKMPSAQYNPEAPSGFGWLLRMEGDKTENKSDQFERSNSSEDALAISAGCE
jgi:hypothetical protein